MDNRFKTRAWLINEKRMVEVNALKADGTIIFELNEIIYASHESFHIKLQCTGLLATASYRGESEKDRLIFEGDVIQTTNGYIFSVVWCESTAEFGVVNKFGEPGARWYLGVDLEIIGNVHEHPELLAQAK